jgi:Tfp pilus assembly protein PilX
MATAYSATVQGQQAAGSCRNTTMVIPEASRPLPLGATDATTGHRRTTSQTGFSTLLMVLVLLAISTMAALSTARTANKGLHISGAQWTYQQAFTNAEEGLKAAKISAAAWPIDTGTSSFNCNTPSRTLTVTGKYSATISCTASQLTIVATGTYNAAGTGDMRATATSKTSYILTGSAGTSTSVGSGSSDIFVATGNIEAVSNGVDINPQATDDAGGVYRPIGYGTQSSKGSKNKFSAGTQQAMVQLTASQIANFQQLTAVADATVQMSTNGNVCSDVQSALNNNPNASIIRLTLRSNDHSFTLPQCAITNNNYWNASTQSYRIPTLVFDGDVDFNGNAVAFYYANVIVLGDAKGVASLHVVGSVSGVPTTTSSTGSPLAATLKPGSWIDY